MQACASELSRYGREHNARGFRKSLAAVADPALCCSLRRLFDRPPVRVQSEKGKRLNAPALRFAALQEIHLEDLHFVTLPENVQELIIIDADDP